MIHVVTVADLRRTAVTPAIVGDDAVALSEEEQHLRVPVIRTQGPTVMKDNGLGALRPPILVENLCPILGRSECHGLDSLFLGGKAYLGLSGCGDGGEQRRRGDRGADGKGCPSIELKRPAGSPPAKQFVNEYGWGFIAM